MVAGSDTGDESGIMRKRKESIKFYSQILGRRIPVNGGKS
jgi:hypothetical protein